MKKSELFLAEKLEKRGEMRRFLPNQSGLCDFSSNDYLGIAHNSALENAFRERLASEKNWFGSTGSRLLTGNNTHLVLTEEYLAKIFDAEAALLFPSGFSANSTLLSALAQKGDLILFDELIHASLKDGYRLSFAERKSFKHNDLEDLENKLATAKGHYKEIFVVTETVFSMDGDSPDLPKMTQICGELAANLIADEAHGTGIYGKNGAGKIIAENLQTNFLARVYTFGKAAGCAGACVVGSKLLKEFLVNFGLGFIYTTAVSPLAALQIQFSMQSISENPEWQEKLHENIAFFKKNAAEKKIDLCAESNSGIQMIACQSVAEAKIISQKLFAAGFEVRPILPPTSRTPRLRVCLHTHNTREEIIALTGFLTDFRI
jgi:8-amino-7-oxononanoate synthase